MPRTGSTVVPFLYLGGMTVIEQCTSVQSAANDEPPANRPADIITTSRLRLRRPAPADVASLQLLNANPDVTRWLHWHTAGDSTNLKYDLSRYSKQWRLGRSYFWIIETRTSHSMIGYIASQRSKDSADIGFVIDPAHWNRGYATEAAIAVVAELIRLKGLTCLVAACDVRNEASARVLQRAGLTYQGQTQNLVTAASTAADRFTANLFKRVITDPLA